MASDVFFSTNPSDWVALEGLYISERNPPGFIRGASLSRVGFGGKCVRGPLTVQDIDSVPRFIEVYGARDFGSGGTLQGEVWKALLNKPFGPITVRRVAASDAVAGTVNLADVVPTDIIQVDAANVGAWSLAANNGPTVSVEEATDGTSTKFNLRVKYLGAETLYENLNTNTAADDNLAEVVGDDIGNLVVLTKLADGRPLDIADEPLASGADGTLAASDYESGLDDLAAADGVAIVLIPEIPVTPATIATKLSTLAAAAVDRVFLTWPMVASETVANAITDVATYTASDRIIYCYNDPLTLDPDTGLTIQSAPHIWMASILSGNDVDVHPGAQQTVAQTAGIARLANTALTRANLISLRDAGISTLEKVSGVHLFRSGKTTDLTTGKTEITRRRMADFLQLSASSRLRFFVKEKNTVEVRAQMISELTAFSQGLKDEGRIIEDFQIDNISVNTANLRAQGLEKILWRVKLISHILHLVLETQIGTGVTIES